MKKADSNIKIININIVIIVNEIVTTNVNKLVSNTKKSHANLAVTIYNNIIVAINKIIIVYINIMASDAKADTNIEINSNAKKND